MRASTRFAGLAALAASALLAGFICSGGPAEHTPFAPEDALSASTLAIADAGSFVIRYRLEIEAEGLTLTAVEGESGFKAGDLVYDRQHFPAALLADEPTETLFVPPDLYLRDPDGTWYVMSPWTQGTRPDEVPVIGDPAIEYGDLVRELRGVEALPDETMGDETFLHYRASLSDTTFEQIAAAPVASTAELHVELWLRQVTYQPRKLQIVERGPDGSITVTLEFKDYDTPVLPPRAPEDIRPLRDLQLPAAPCTGEAFAACLGPQHELDAVARPSCDGPGRRVCLVPFGQVSTALVQHLVDYYRDQLGLTVTVLTPQGVPEAAVDPLRGQVETGTLIGAMQDDFFSAYADPEAVMIGLTPVDLYDADSHYRYVFGVRGSAADPKGAVSTFRMDPRTYGEPGDDGLLFSRTRKMASKYIGLLYYELPPSSDPASPMFDSILGVSDLDAMGEPLIVP